jgi:predicted small secreted protein
MKRLSLCIYIFGIAAGVIVQKYFTRDYRSQRMELCLARRSMQQYAALAAGFEQRVLPN